MQIYEEHFFCPSCQATFTSFYFHIQNVQCNSLAARTLHGVRSRVYQIFWHLKTGTFGESARFQVPKNGTSSTQIQKRNPKTSRNTPQNGGVDIWVMRFHFRVSIKPIFENHVFRAVLGPFHPLYETKNSNRSPSVVYGSITLIFFGGSGN